MSCFGDYLLKNTENWPDRLAIVSEQCELTYRQLNDQSNCVANALKRMGLGRGDRLALLMQSCTEWLLVWYACQKLGVTVVPLHVRLLPQELARMIKLAGASALIFSSAYDDQAHYLMEHDTGIRCFVRYGSSPDGVEPGTISWEALLANSDEAEAQVALDGSDESVILSTSGTTGVSKGVLRTQQIVCSHAEVLAAGDENDGAPMVVLTPAPLYHTAGLFCVFKTAACAGTLVLVNGFHPEKICMMIERYAATQVLLVPPISYQRMYLSGFAQQHDLSSVKLALLTAGKCTEACLMNVFDMFPGCKVRPSWGSTEVCSATGANLSKEDLTANPERMCTVGKCNNGVEIRLVDEKGNDVPDGESGEALVRSSMVFHGYLGAPEKTAECFSGDWFRTEDIMKRDADGFYYLLDRKRDIVKTGGENVYAQEVERVLQRHPAIADSAVIGVPDKRFGEAIAAAIVLNPGCDLQQEAFLQFCAEQLASFKKPRYWAVMEELPTNDVGKVQKMVLRHDAEKLFTRIA